MTQAFVKDILIIDFETTHGIPAKAKPTQLAAILLDKATLKEKKFYASFIKQDLADANSRSLEISGITKEDLKTAPPPTQVAREFVDSFGTDVFLSSWNEALDRRMLEVLLKSIDLDITDYDYHYLDIWPIAYTYLVKKGKGQIVRSEDTFQEFGLPPRANHDALEDCRHAAEVLRFIINH